EQITGYTETGNCLPNLNHTLAPGSVLFIHPFHHTFCKVVERLARTGFFASFGERNWFTRVACLPDAGIQLNSAQERNAIDVGRALPATLGEDIHLVLAMRTD